MNPEMLNWIEKEKPGLVGWAEDYVKKSELYMARSNGRKARVSGSQLRNLLNAAQHGEPLAVLINFLRYQIGRGGRGWGHKKSGQALEELLSGKLAELCQKGTKESGADRYGLESALAAQLLGFIIREYTYRCSLEGTQP